MTDLDKDLETVPEVGINVVDQSRERDRRQWSRTVSKDRGSRPRSESRSRSSCHVSTNRDRLRCFRCSEYDHFARKYPNVLTEDDSDQEDLGRATLQMLAQEDSLNYAEMEEHIKGKNGPITFLPNTCRIGGTFKNINQDDRYLTEDQARYICKKVNVGKEIEIKTIKQEIEPEKSIKSEIEDISDNTYKKGILNEVNKNISSQMEDWSILSDHVKICKNTMMMH